MAERDRSHIVIPGLAASEGYRRPPQAIQSRRRRIPANRQQHGEDLASQLRQAEQDALARRQEAGFEIAGAVDGIYVAFESFAGLEEAIQSLDLGGRGQRPQLRMVKTVLVGNRTLEQAVVFVPDGKVGYFLRRIERYLASLDKENPSNANLIDRIDRISTASLEQLWTDVGPFPLDGGPVWWEVWLRKRDGEEVARLRAFGEASGAKVGGETLGFADRIVVLVRATVAELSRALDVLDDVAELRRPRERASLITLQDSADQAEWVADLAGRVTAAGVSAPAATLLDTGVYQPHPVLADSIDMADCHACDPAWGDQDHHGHGTEMAGLALYGDLGSAVVSGGPVNLRHRLESVKLLPPAGANDPRLWGALTATATSVVEVQAPDRRRAFGMAVTAQRDPVDPTQANQLHLGEPTSWSAAVDALAAGLAIETSDEGMVYLAEEEDRERRLFVVAAGNVDQWDNDHLARSDLEPIEDPGQAWNALTVGAYTDVDTIDPKRGLRGLDGPRRSRRAVPAQSHVRRL